VDRIASEIAEEVAVLFQHPHRNPGTGKKQSRHHTRRPAADNDNVNHCGFHAVHDVDGECTAPSSPMFFDALMILGAARTVIQDFVGSASTYS
jgi:hypothetical protein